MLQVIIDKFVKYDAEDKAVYASKLWSKLISLLDFEAGNELLVQYDEEKIPVQLMVQFTQQHFLRKKDQRWALENYDDFSSEKKAALEQLLNEYGQLEAQAFPTQTEYALFLGTSTANLAKRAFHLFDELVHQGAVINNCIIMGTDEPYDAFMGTICSIVESHPDYFREDLTVADVPTQATAHEVMLFLFDNLRWPEGKKPNAILLPQVRPCNTNNEIDSVSEFLIKSGALSSFQPKVFSSNRCQITVLSHQPFNDRQALVTLTGFLNAGIQDRCDITVAGAGLNTYTKLNKLPASNMSPAQLIDNLARALYEINQNLSSLFVVEATLSNTVSR